MESIGIRWGETSRKFLYFGAKRPKCPDIGAETSWANRLGGETSCTHVAPPWQCYNCQGFGHNASECKVRLPKCVVCAKAHSSTDCPEKAKTQDKLIKCVNCGKSHVASYGGCEIFKKAKAIQKIKAHEKISYKEAEKKFKIDKRTKSTVSSQQLRNPSSTISYASALRNPYREVQSPTQMTQESPNNTIQEIKIIQMLQHKLKIYKIIM